MKKLFRQKIVDPIMHQITQGVSPKKLALSVAFGVILGIIPLFGITTGLCLGAAFVFRLNHVAIQAANYLVYALQLVLLIPFMRLGEKLFLVEPALLSVPELTEAFQSNFFGALKVYGASMGMGVMAWALISPIVFVLVYGSSLKVFNKLAKKT